MGLGSIRAALHGFELPGPVHGPGIEELVDAQQQKGSQRAGDQIGRDQLGQAQAAGAHGGQFRIFAQLPQGVEQGEQEGHWQQIRQVGRQQDRIIEQHDADRRAGFREVHEIAEQIHQNGDDGKAGHDVDPRPAQMAQKIAGDQFHVGSIVAECSFPRRRFRAI